MTWTPLIASTAFDGIHADLVTVATGIVACALIVVGIALLVKAFT